MQFLSKHKIRWLINKNGLCEFNACKLGFRAILSEPLIYIKHTMNTARGTSPHSAMSNAALSHNEYDIIFAGGMFIEYLDYPIITAMYKVVPLHV